MTKEQAIRECILKDTLFATQFFFSCHYKRKFNVGRHHKIMAAALDDVFEGRCNRLIINVPPRYSKTEMLKSFVVKGLGINPASKYIMLSYSANLALENSEKIKDVCTEGWYQQIFPKVVMKADSKSKQNWRTTMGGGVYAVSSQGQVTGFGAGIVSTEESDPIPFINGEEEDDEEFEKDENADKNLFGGAIIIDDPLKVIDADSPVVRQKVIDIFEGTIRSRVNDRNTPIIVIMQRLHKDDLAGHLQRPEEQDDWRVVSLPAIIKNDKGEEESLYPFKYTLEELHKMRDNNPYVFETQYQQNPKAINEKHWLFAFKYDRNVGVTSFNPNFPIYISFDFNKSPLTCSIWQIVGDWIYGIDSIALDNATTRMMCEEIAKRYPNSMKIITGDCSGNQRSTMSQLTNYQEIRLFFRLGSAAMQVSNTNPGLSDSRIFMNNLFEQYNILIDGEKCKPLIFDFENVMSDEENKPIKSSRENVAQRADMLDNARYFFHRFYKLFIPAN